MSLFLAVAPLVAPFIDVFLLYGVVFGPKQKTVMAWLGVLAIQSGHSTGPGTARTDVRSVRGRSLRERPAPAAGSDRRDRSASASACVHGGGGAYGPFPPAWGAGTVGGYSPHRTSPAVALAAATPRR
ncbi:hypothetical protein BIV24_24100 [Streptomyces colonosanans]|uniref:Uncharacterized protein n=1 Tax=Streptomyces colonosanans TaxID=1428652 RepID=A0A1S2P2E4_9ACTN|nr:hypothetical protein BIV24_24100 [Streptomyces colonosanans]